MDSLKWGSGDYCQDHAVFLAELNFIDDLSWKGLFSEKLVHNDDNSLKENVASFNIR